MADVTDEPIDLAPIADRDAHAECAAPLCHQPEADRRALLAEVKRLRAQLADAWDDGHDAGIDHAHQIYTNNPYRTQPEETGSAPNWRGSKPMQVRRDHPS